MMKAALLAEILCVCAVGGFLFLTGCGHRECAPQIVGEVVIPVFAPLPPKPKPVEDANITAGKLGIPVEWLPPKDREHNWSAIIIHHSATDRGNTAYFDKEHRSRVADSGEPWAGVGYDFVIGNDTLSGDSSLLGHIARRPTTGRILTASA
jgi:hypothetical protein